MYACTKTTGSQMDTSVLVLLLSAGADPNAQAEEGSIALIVAAKYNNCIYYNTFFIIIIKKVL